MRLAITGIGLCYAMLLPTGCIQWPGTRGDRPQHATVTRESLAVHLSADRDSATVGDVVRLTLTARNLSRKPIPIRSATAAPVIATLWRYDAAKGWVRVKQFPVAPLRRYQQWELTKHEQRAFSLVLPVQPDWPVLTKLKLSAELNGRPDARPHVFICIQPK